MNLKTLAKLLLNQHNFILIVGVGAGFFFYPVSQYSQHFIVLLLIVAMTLSMSRVDIKQVFSPSQIIRPTLIMLVFNFILLGGANVLLGYLLTQDTLLRAGFILLASAPPSLAIPAFAYNLKGNINTSLVGTTMGYLASMAIMPLAVGIFGHEYDISKLLITIFQIIFLPLLLSQVYRTTKIARQTEKYHGHIINWCIAVVAFTLVGLNHASVISADQDMVVPLIVAIVTIFGLGELIYLVCKRKGIPHSETVNYMLFGTMKKWAGASAVALVVFGAKASLPGAIAISVGFLYYCWLVIRWGNKAVPSG
ncbi:MAG: hypothetical protein AAC993_05170 [Dehalococcoides mccartyi]|uniref:bile acid:sodium symporter family protein n=1 Tax=Dehalococcoides mccartyi TaxID=61435 RepID=UPI0030F78A07